MKKNQKHSMQKDLVPFHVIKAASEGDVGAINAILQHYHGYITSLSTRRMYDEFGQSHYCVDETLYRRLFFASTFWRKLQNIFGEYCIAILEKVATPG